MDETNILSLHKCKQIYNSPLHSHTNVMESIYLVKYQKNKVKNTYSTCRYNVYPYTSLNICELFEMFHITPYCTSHDLSL